VQSLKDGDDFLEQFGREAIDQVDPEGHFAKRRMITLESGPPKPIDGFEPRRSVGRQQLNQRRETSMKANGLMQLN
jgi:hypothetical protein